MIISSNKDLILIIMYKKCVYIFTYIYVSMYVCISHLDYLTAARTKSEKKCLLAFPV